MTRNLVTLLAVVTLAVSGAACTRSGARKIASNDDLKDTVVFTVDYSVITRKGLTPQVYVAQGRPNEANIVAFSYTDTLGGKGFTCSNATAGDVTKIYNGSAVCTAEPSTSETPETRTLSVTYYLKKYNYGFEAGSNAAQITRAIAEVERGNYSGEFARIKSSFYAASPKTHNLPFSLNLSASDQLELGITGFFDVRAPRLRRMFLSKKKLPLPDASPYAAICRFVSNDGAITKTIIQTDRSVLSSVIVAPSDGRVSCLVNNPEGLAKAKVAAAQVQWTHSAQRDVLSNLNDVLSNDKSALARRNAKLTDELLVRTRDAITASSKTQAKEFKVRLDAYLTELGRKERSEQLYAILPLDRNVDAKVVSSRFWMVESVSSLYLKDGSIHSYMNLSISDNRVEAQVGNDPKPGFLSGYTFDVFNYRTPLMVATSTEVAVESPAHAHNDPGKEITVCAADITAFKDALVTLRDSFGVKEAPSLEEAKKIVMSFHRDTCDGPSDQTVIPVALHLTAVKYTVGSRMYELLDERVKRNYIEFYPLSMSGEYVAISPGWGRSYPLYDDVLNDKGEIIDTVQRAEYIEVKQETAPRFFASVLKTNTSTDQVRGAKKLCLESTARIDDRLEEHLGLDYSTVEEVLKRRKVVDSANNINLDMIACDG